VDYDYKNPYSSLIKYSKGDSLINRSKIKFYGNLSNRKPDYRLGFLGQLVSAPFVFQFYPIITNGHQGYHLLGTNYIRDGISGRIDKSRIMIISNKYFFQIGRSRVKWGESQFNSLIQSGDSPGYENMSLKVKVSSSTFIEILHGQLNSNYLDNGEKVNRFLGAHKIKLNLNENLSFSLGEQILYTGVNRGVELLYLNPFVPYFFSGLEGEELTNPSDNDNSIIFANFRYISKHFYSFYSELIIDDYQVDNTGLDHALGYLIGYDYNRNYDNIKLRLKVEYASVDPWTYIHHGQFTSWENRGHSIGFPLGPDSELFEIYFDYQKKKKSGTSIKISHLSYGENNLRTVWKNFPEESNINNTNYNIVFLECSVYKYFKYGIIELGWSNIPYLNKFSIMRQSSSEGVLFIRTIIN